MKNSKPVDSRSQRVRVPSDALILIFILRGEKRTGGGTDREPAIWLKFNGGVRFLTPLVSESLSANINTMKKLIEITEGEGFEALLGENVLIFCMNYIYTGKLVGVNDTCIKLDDAKLVYETGSFADKDYKDAQSLPNATWYVQTSSIESFGVGK